MTAASTDPERLGLADRCEAASGPDRDLNYDLLMALGWGRSDGYAVNPDGQRVMMVPDYTASLDVAMSLVPEGASSGFSDKGDGTAVAACYLRDGPGLFSDAATPALALCAAALRARAHQETRP